MGLCQSFISTHTLRKEGDNTNADILQAGESFQPTPSARRVTNTSGAEITVQNAFQPTPSARRVTLKNMYLIWGNLFQPTPSARRVT